MAAVSFNILNDLRMSFHPNYSGDIVDGPSGWGVVGLGQGHTRITCQVIIDQADTVDVNVYIFINGVRQYIFGRSAFGVNTIHTYDGELILNNGDVINVQVENNDAGGINVLGSFNALNTRIILEGL